MSILEKTKHIAVELKGHAPFTIFGALIGIAFMLFFNAVGKPEPHTLFVVFHPAHVVLSAMVTASLFKIHENKKHILLIFVIGYTGSIGVATLSDCIVPFIGEKILGLDIPTHADLHSHAGTYHENHTGKEPLSTDHTQEEHKGHSDHQEPAGHEHTADCEHQVQVHDCNQHDEHGSGHSLHLGFIEEWYIVNPAAILGILIALFIPRTKFPHGAHVLVSTWASSAHIMMNSAGAFSFGDIGGIFVILFVAVWLPCCISDIVFPLLFVKSDLDLVSTCTCKNHKIHSHDHIHEHSDKCPGEEDSK